MGTRATEILKSKSVCSTDDVIDVIRTCVRQSQIVTKTNDSSFSFKLPVLATFWIAKTQIFFHFPTPNFCRTVPVEHVHQCRNLITGLKHAIAPYCSIVLVLFYNIWQFSMKICTQFRNLGWKPRKFQQNRWCFGSRNWETMRMWFAQLHHDVMNI